MTETTTIAQGANNRVRMNVSLTAKGLAQFDVTSEFDDPQKAAANLDEAIKQIREVLKANNLQEVGSVEMK